jgi:hypothetical protein
VLRQNQRPPLDPWITASCGPRDRVSLSGSTGRGRFRQASAPKIRAGPSDFRSHIGSDRRLQVSDELTRLPSVSRRDDPMDAISPNLSTILGRILDTATASLRVATILTQLGLDPNNVTYHALLNRLLEIVLANITLANMFALFGAIFFVATLLMQTMVPLRVANMAG